jgi:hypothetical protein
MFHPCSTLPHLLMPGIDGMGWFLSPSCTKMGRMKWAGDSQFSRMPWRKVALRRLRRGLEGRSCLMQERVGEVGGGGDRMGVVAWSVGYCEKGREAACCLELAGGVGQ